jgi:hypothetical protein
LEYGYSFPRSQLLATSRLNTRGESGIVLLLI